MKKARICKYPGCAYYDKSAKRYCRIACSCDHHDYIRMLDDIYRRSKR